MYITKETCKIDWQKNALFPVLLSRVKNNMAALFSILTWGVSKRCFY